MVDPPLILAGPILRRVEPASISVWIALSAPRTVHLSVWEGTINAGTDKNLFSNRPAPLVQSARRTMRIGAQLHLALVTALPPVALLAGRIYSYFLAFGDVDTSALDDQGIFDAAAFVATDDLKSLGLLLDAEVGDRGHLALGYDAGELPGFSTPPPALSDLRLLHGSCRRPGHVSTDEMARIDDLILAWRNAVNNDPLHRPHQLFLSGDQIYADDVAEPLLPLLTEVGNDLLGATERVVTRFPLKPGEPLADDLADEKKAKALARKLKDPCLLRYSKLIREPFITGEGEPVPDAPELSAWPVDARHFPARLRTSVIQCEARLTTEDPENHLISFAEYCAMYLFVWCNAVWPLNSDGRPAFKELQEIIKLPDDPPRLWELHTVDLKCRVPSNNDRIAALRDCLQEKADSDVNYAGHVKALNAFYDSLPKVRRALANIPTYMIFDDHDVTDDFFINRAWRDSVLSAPMGRAIIRNGMVSYALFQGWGSDPERFMRFSDESQALSQLLSSPQTMLDLDGAANGLLLLAAQGLFPETSDIGPDPVAANIADRLLGLRSADEPPRTRWHFSLDGPQHRVLALDTRTQRLFRGRYTPPGLISPAALLEQIAPEPQEPLPAGIEVLVVLSATPVLWPSLTTSLVVPLHSRLNDARHYRQIRNQAGIDPDVEIWPADPESFEALLNRLAFYRRVVVLSGETHHAFSAVLSYWRTAEEQRIFTASETFTPMLDRCELPADLRSAFENNGRPLSADAKASPRPGHAEWVIEDRENGALYMLRRERDAVGGDQIGVFLDSPPARIANFTSSGLKNTVKQIAMVASGLGFAIRLFNVSTAERFIWARSSPPPLLLPAAAQLPPSVRASLVHSPLLISPRGWPTGTTIDRTPDAAWRFESLSDQRPDAERDKASVPDTLAAEFDPADPATSYRHIARRHASLIDDKLRHSRSVLYRVNVAQIRFEQDESGLTAIHELYSGKTKPVVIHRASLDRFDEPRPRLVFRHQDEESEG